jgi:glycosyltransferase involved in cell wall biosynthesis
MTPLRISIVTPSYNQGVFIRRTIDSVLEQAGRFELEYLVYDGGSTDDTVDILRSYGDRLRWYSGRDDGQVDAINKGLRAATGDIVGWLNSDDVLAPGALQRVSEAFEAYPRLEWVHGRCDIIDAEDRLIRRWISAYKHWCSLHYSYSRLLTENIISQMTVYWRRSVLEEIGYVDPRLKLAFDYDLWLRLARRGDPIYIPERQASFRSYETNKSANLFEEQFREDYAIAQRHAPERIWLLRWKRVKGMRTVGLYRAMRLFRSLGRQEQ